MGQKGEAGNVRAPWLWDPAGKLWKGQHNVLSLLWPQGLHPYLPRQLPQPFWRPLIYTRSS